MKLAYILTILALFHTLQTLSQQKLQGSISGNVLDSSTQQPLASATISLTSYKDSTRIALVTTDQQGGFRLTSIPFGAYQLHISYMGYQPHVRHILLNAEHASINAGQVLLLQKGVQLRSVDIVKKRPPMRVKKDTIEFNAEYFNTRPDGYIEELLKKLPGIQISKDGTIMVNGQPVDELLIDGQPFFSGDPTMATRNLNALIVDKIQLIDAVGEWERFTGAGNARKKKQLNIIIKNQYKKGFVGSVTGGYGTEGTFAAKGNLNRFRDQQRLSLLGSGDNVNGNYDNAAQPANIPGGGIARSWQAGVNYNEAVSGSLRLTGNYAVNNVRNIRQSTNARQNILPDTAYYYDQQLKGNDNETNHKLFLRIDHKKDTQYIFIAAVSLNYNTYTRTQTNGYTTLDADKAIVNQGNISDLNTGNTPKVETAISFGRSFKKKGRAMGIMASFNNSQQDQQQRNDAYSTFFLTGGGKKTDTIRQDIDNGITDRQLSFNIHYTEPVLGDHLLNIGYGLFQTKSHSNRYVYDYNAVNGKYDLFNTDLSSQFESTIASHFFHVGLKRITERYDYEIGSSMQTSFLNNLNGSTHNRIRLTVARPLFHLTVNYNVNKHTRFNTFYYSSLEQPGISQLQPVPDNTNPLYVQTGNPDLQPAYMHNLNLEYNTINPQTMRVFNVQLKTQLINNKIVNSSWLDTLGRQVSQPVNASGAHNATLTLTNTFPIKGLQTFINCNTAFAYARDISYMNNARSNVDNYIVNQRLGLNYSVEELLELSLEGGLTYTVTAYSSLKESNTRYCSYTCSLAGMVHLPLGLTINGNMFYQGTTGLAAGFNQDRLLLNSGLSKNIGKRAIARIQGFDLLNQNRGIMRTVGPNYVEDARNNTLQRFFMLGFTWMIRPRTTE